MVPRVMMKKKMTALLPHCAGDSQASPVMIIVATSPKADGLKMCFFWKRKMYFDATVRKAARRLVVQKLVFKRRQRLMALINTLNPHNLNPEFPSRESIRFCLMDSNA